MRDGVSSRQPGRLVPVAIVGPTASGKTAVAIELAGRVGAEIISADSMAVYRGMDIGTAKPTLLEQGSAAFHLIDVVDPDEPFTVADFQEQAVRVIDDLLSRGKLPLLVGGTGLYIRAVLDGLNIPGSGPDPELRERLRKRAVEEGSVALHKELERVDPETAARLHPNDAKRIIRALEVFEQSGKPMSEVIEETRVAPRYPDALQFGLTMDREKLYRRIEERVDLQIAEGLVEEVRSLLEKGYNTDAPAMQGLGYKEIAAFIEGKSDLASAIDTLKQGTRRFAKRQYTWFRADARIDWINVDALSAAEAADIIEAKLREAGVLG
jgi:tRNA dimethylallyltransferase